MSEKSFLQTEKAPAPVGPYSQGVQAGSFVFLSGQIALDPESGQMIQDSIEVETETVIKNLKAILQCRNLTLENVVKTTVYMTDLGQFAAMNQVYAKHFPTPGPARAAIEVKALPKNANVEIELVALIPQR